MRDYSGYIFAAYGFAAVLIGYLTVKITLDYRDLQQQLARFSARDNNR